MWNNSFQNKMNVPWLFTIETKKFLQKSSFKQLSSLSFFINSLDPGWYSLTISLLSTEKFLDSNILKLTFPVLNKDHILPWWWYSLLKSNSFRVFYKHFQFRFQTLKGDSKALCISHISNWYFEFFSLGHTWYPMDHLQVMICPNQTFAPELLGSKVATELGLILLPVGAILRSSWV